MSGDAQGGEYDGLILKEILPLGGVDLMRDPHAIPDDHCAWAKNVFPKAPGKLAKRLGAKYLAPTGFNDAHGALAQDNWLPTGLIFPAGLTNIDFGCSFIDNGASPKKAYFGAGRLTITDAEVGNPSPAEIPYLANHRPALLHYTAADGPGILIVTGTKDGTAQFYKWTWIATDGGYNGKVAGVFAGTQSTAIPAPRVVGTYRRRYVFANLGPNYENCLFFSDPDAPTVVGDDVMTAGRLYRLPMAGDQIIAVVEIAQSSVGSPLESALLIMGKYSAFVMAGDTAYSSATSDYTGSAVFNQVQEECGCAAAATVVRTPYGVIWASHDDVWKFDNGAVPVRIGTKIRPALLDCEPDDQWMWHAVYCPDNGTYRLAINPPSGSEGIKPCTDQWWLDLRDGSPQGIADARWWGPQQYRMNNVVNGTDTFGTYAMAIDRRTGEERRAYALHRANHPLYASSAYVPVIVQLDEQEGYDNARPETYNDYDTGDPITIPAREQANNEVAIEILTKQFSFQDHMHDKTAEGVEISLASTKVLELKVETIIDGGRQVSTSLEIADFPDTNPNGPTAGYHDYRQEQAIIINPDRDVRLTGKTIQYRIYDLPGFPIATSNDFLPMAVGSTLHPEVTLAHGHYDDITAILTAILAAIDAYDADWPWTSSSEILGTTLIRLRISYLAAYLAFVPETTAGTTEAALRTRRLWALLGFDTTAGQTPNVGGGGVGGATYLDSITSALRKVSAPLEIASIVARYEGRAIRRP